MSLPAEIFANVENDQRGVVRRTLRLRVNAQLEGHAIEAEIRNLSETGLLVETTADLTMGESFYVALPEAGTLKTKVVWGRGRIFGCEFEERLPKGVLSAALLRSANERSGLSGTAAEEALGHLEPTLSETSFYDNSLLVWAVSFAVLVVAAIIAIQALAERWPGRS